MAIEKNVLSKSSHQGNSSSKISESQLNDLRLKYTKDSAQGEILKICRDMM